MLRLDRDERCRSFRRSPFGDLRALAGEEHHRLAVIRFQRQLPFFDRDAGSVGAARADRHVGPQLGIYFTGSAGHVDAKRLALLRIAQPAHDHTAPPELDVARGIEEHGRVFGEIDARRGVRTEPGPRAARARHQRARREFVPSSQVFAARTVAIAAGDRRSIEPERRVDVEHLDAVGRGITRPSTAGEGENADDERCRAAVDRHEIPRSSPTCSVPRRTAGGVVNVGPVEVPI